MSDNDLLVMVVSPLNCNQKSVQHALQMCDNNDTRLAPAWHTLHTMTTSIQYYSGCT